VSKRKNKQPRPITVKELHRLGYIPGGVISIGPNVSGIYEMKNEDGKQASFSYLQARGDVDGFILPLPFSEYLKHHEFDLSDYQEHP
jgi:hypothetical protein